MLLGGSDVDILNGGEGNDQLKGGAGVDVYQFNGNYGTDVITDADGQGVIAIGGSTGVSGPALNSGSFQLENIYKNDATGYNITKVNDGNTLILSKDGEDNRIIINNWTDTNSIGGATLGLSLTGEMPVASQTTHSGDFKKLINDNGTPGDTSDDTFVMTDGNYTLDPTAIGGESGALDLITGTAGGDGIFGLGGSDALFGEGGNDYIDGGSEGDVLEGGSGADTLIGGTGSDIIYGSGGGSTDKPTDANHTPPTNPYDNPRGSGFNWTSGYDVGETFPNGVPSGRLSDTISRSVVADDQGNIIDGGAGDDFIAAGTGADTVFGGTGKDLIYGMDKDDILLGGGDNDVIYGDGDTSSADGNSVIYSLDDGNDIIDGGAGDDIIFGGGGDDIIYGGDDNDFLYGDDSSQENKIGDDRIYGGAGTDTLVGDDGNDYLDGGSENDTLFGGEGNDTLIGGTGADQFFGGAGADTIYLNTKENDSLGGTQDLTDTIIRDVSSTENETITAEKDQNGAVTGKVFFALAAGEVTEISNGIVGDSDYTYTYADGAQIKHSELLGTKLNTTIDLVSESNALFGGMLDDSLTAFGATNSTLYGGLGNDTLTGAAGNNTLQGGDGDDILIGAAGDDSLLGGAGADNLTGGLGNDVLEGGLGDDTYVYRRGDKADTIIDVTGELNILSFGFGIANTDVTLRTGAATIDLGDGDTINIANFDSNNPLNSASVNAFQFQDGSTLSIDQLVARGFDTIGTDQNDQITGTDYIDRISGLEGDDVLSGGAEQDELVGGDGNDTLIGGTGNDILQGGAGDDVYQVSLGDGRDVIDDTQGINQVVFGEGITYADIQVEQYQDRFGGQYLSVGYGDGDALTIYNGMSGNIQSYQFFDGTVVSHTDLLSISGGLNISGTENNDTIFGSNDHDSISGYGGNDQIYGNLGDDDLYGGGGADTLDGGDGDDILDGGSGDDVLIGGLGDDEYLMSWGMGQDTIIELNTVEPDENGGYILLDEGISLADIGVKQKGNDVLVHFKGTDDGMLIKEYNVNQLFDWYVAESSPGDNPDGEPGFTTVAQLITDQANDNQQSSIAKELSDYEVNAKAAYFTQLGEDGYKLGDDGLMRKTELNVNGLSSTTNYRTNDFTVVSQETNAGNIGRSSLLYTTTGEVLSSQTDTTTSISQVTYLEGRYVEYPAVFVAIPGQGVGAVSIPGPGDRPYTIIERADGVTGISFLPFGKTVYEEASKLVETTVSFTTTIQSLDTTLNLEKISAGDADNYIDAQQSFDNYISISAGAGNDTIVGGGVVGGAVVLSSFYSVINYDELGAFYNGEHGADLIYGSKYNDVIIGGDGADTLDGGYGGDRYVFYADDTGIDTVSDIASLGAFNSDTFKSSYHFWHYRTMGYAENEIYSLAEAPYIDATDYDALIPLYEAGLIEKDTVEFGEGIELANLTIEKSSTKLFISWGVGKGVQIDLAQSRADVVNAPSPGGPGGPQSPFTASGNWGLGEGIEQFKFADGNIMTIKAILDLAIDAPDPKPIINGTDGDDQLDGAGDDFVMIGGLGDDSYTVDSAGDEVVENPDEGYDQVESSISYTLADNIEELYLTGTDNIDGTGNDLDNYIEGNEGDNILIGGAGDDYLDASYGGNNTLYGGEGDDSLDGSSDGNDLLDGGEGDDELDGYGGQDTLIGGAGSDYYYLYDEGVLSNTIINEVGNAATDVDVVNIGDYSPDDVTLSKSNNDLVLNYDGNTATITDWYVADSNTIEEIVFDYEDANGDYVSTTWDKATITAMAPDVGTITGTDGDDSLVGDAGNNVLDGGLGNDNLYGGEGTDTLLGGAGNDYLNGGLGSDAMSGGTGDDIYLVDDAGDTVTENGTEGYDRVNASISYTLGDNVERLILIGDADTSGTGNDLDNLLTGNIGNNVLDGGLGNDNLYGGNGVDLLQGGLGNDIMNGGAGNGLLYGGLGTDRLIGGADNDIMIAGTGNEVITTRAGHDVISFNLGDGQDIVQASSEADNTLSLGGNFAYSDLSLSKSGNHLVFKVGATDQVTLQNWYTGAGNQSVANLQVIAEAIDGFDLGGADTLRDNKVEQFDFAALVAEFDAAGSPSDWQLTDGLLTTHLQTGSDSAAIGGDLAYQYGLNGNLTGMGTNHAQSTISNTNFGQSAQALNDPSAWAGEAVKLA